MIRHHIWNETLSQLTPVYETAGFLKTVFVLFDWAQPFSKALFQLIEIADAAFITSKETKNFYWSNTSEFSETSGSIHWKWNIS